LVGILSLLIALTVGLIITRVAAMALMTTGLSRESARFQARSAFTGVGYTTSESESIVNHPVRRRIVMMLMLVGNIGIATVAATLMASMLFTAGAEAGDRTWMLALLAAGLLALWFAANNRWVERRLNRIIARALRRFTDLDVRDYVALLELAHGYAITEMMVESGDWLENKSLTKLRLPDEGVLVLGIHPREGDYRGTPVGSDVIRAGDTLIIYGALARLEELDRRRAGYTGDKAHAEAVEEQEEVEEAQILQREEDIAGGAKPS